MTVIPGITGNRSSSGAVSVIAVSGKKNVGKTTLIVNLIPRMSARGWTVCTVKHHHFGDFEPDTPGKDSHRHYEAGARGVILSSPYKLGYFERREGTQPEISDLLNHFPTATDLVFAEGYHRSAYPHIEVSRRAVSQTLIADARTPLLAIVADYDPGVNVPVFHPSEVDDLADFLDTRLREKDPGE